MVRAVAVAVCLHVLAAPGQAQGSGESLPLPIRAVDALGRGGHAATAAGRVERLPAAAEVARLRNAADEAITAALVAGDALPERQRRLADAISHARAALALDPDDARARFFLGAAIGMGIEHQGARGKMRSAREVRELAEAILADDPKDPGGLHLMGQLHGAAMRLGGIEKFFARTLFGGGVLEDASWEEAEAAFRDALEAEPDNLAHRLELARVLRDTGRTEEARRELQKIVESTDPSPLADVYRREAWEKLAALN